MGATGATAIVGGRVPARCGVFPSSISPAGTLTLSCESGSKSQATESGSDRTAPQKAVRRNARTALCMMRVAARKGGFVEAFQGDLPCPVSFEKIILFSSDPNHRRIPRRLVPAQRGVGHRHERWARDAVDAAASSREVDRRANFVRERSTRAGRAAQLRTAKPCGPGTRCWCQVGGGVSSPTGSRCTVNSPTTVTRRIRRRGEHGISR